MKKREGFRLVHAFPPNSTSIPHPTIEGAWIVAVRDQHPYVLMPDGTIKLLGSHTQVDAVTG